MTDKDRQGGTPAEAATEFLAAMEERDLERARSYLADDVVMRFPGAEFASLDALVAAAGGRYRWVRKRITATESFAAGEADVVYVRGTLYGENLHGQPFADIRFIDRFELLGGKIVAQDVWNDLAESGVLTRHG